MSYYLANLRTATSKFIESLKIQPLRHVHALEIALLRNRSVNYVIHSAKNVRRVLYCDCQSLGTRYMNERDSSRYKLLIQISTRMVANVPFQI